MDGSLRQQIRVEYGEKPEAEFWKLYVEVGKVSLYRGSSHLKWLSLCQSKERPKELPSWCPNLHSKNEAGLFLDCYLAGFPPGEQGNPQISFPPGTNHLKIKGITTAIVEKVAQLSENWDSEHGPFAGPTEHAQYTMSWMEECLEMSQNAHSKPKHVVLESLTRTMIADTLGGRAGFTTEFVHELWAVSQRYLTLQSRRENVEKLPIDELTKATNFLDAMYHACRNRRVSRLLDRACALDPTRCKWETWLLFLRQHACPLFYAGWMTSRLIGSLVRRTFGDV